MSDTSSSGVQKRGRNWKASKRSPFTINCRTNTNTIENDTSELEEFVKDLIRRVEILEAELAALKTQINSDVVMQDAAGGGAGAGGGAA